ncbi:hypothetical protein VTL71DRAFT_4327 [Oculimacula yallundae]|uniref:Uncharacterized protein n=1 Tax=Oculimacula yallundae TaxID=86028 RepID=A0ABR4C5I1_9HELO
MFRNPFNISIIAPAIF